MIYKVNTITTVKEFKLILKYERSFTQFLQIKQQGNNLFFFIKSLSKLRLIKQFFFFKCRLCILKSQLILLASPACRKEFKKYLLALSGNYSPLYSRTKGSRRKEKYLVSNKKAAGN